MPRRNNPKPQSQRTTQKHFNCLNKRSYLSSKEAQSIAEYQMLIKPFLELKVYHCDICFKWHLTRIDKD